MSITWPVCLRFMYMVEMEPTLVTVIEEAPSHPPGPRIDDRIQQPQHIDCSQSAEGVVTATHQDPANEVGSTEHVVRAEKSLPSSAGECSSYRLEIASKDMS